MASNCFLFCICSPSVFISFGQTETTQIERGPNTDPSGTADPYEGAFTYGWFIAANVISRLWFHDQPHV